MSADLHAYRLPELINRTAELEAVPTEGTLRALERRIGRRHLERRLALEAECERRGSRLSTRMSDIKSWYAVGSVIRACFRFAGLHARAQRNARALQLRENEVVLEGLPGALDGYTILHISDPHLDASPEMAQILIERVHALEYDLCVLTGDYRMLTFGDREPALAAVAQLRASLKAPAYAVLGNHDSIHMVPRFEALGIRVLLNESVAIERQGATLYLAGIDDAHYYGVHDFAKATRSIPPGAPAILLSHTPEAYAHAARAGFKLMLCGHTHGGQICLPGGYPLITDAACPRRYAKGPWRCGNLAGYTSVGSGSSIVDLRLNCPPEVTLHRLHVA